MIAQLDATTAPFGLPPLPKTAVTRDGARFDPHSDVWVINSLARGETRFDFTKFSNITMEMTHKLKHCLMFVIENYSFYYAHNLLKIFNELYKNQLCFNVGNYNEIKLQEITKYRSTLNQNTEWKLGVIRILLEVSGKLGFGITSSDALDYLGAARIRGNVKGTAIRTRQPNKGAFNDTELLAIQSALNDCYARGGIDLDHFAIAWVLLGYGARPIQIAALKESDLIVSESGESRHYALRIPRAKQRGGGIRASHKTRYCSKQIGQLLEKVIDQNRRRRENLDYDNADWPMFMSTREGELPGLRYHIPSITIARMVNDVIGSITGLKTNTKRFRITLAQRAVDDGKDKYTVAELLDHSDTQSVGVYYEASPSMVLRLDRHLAMEMAPLAQAFSGVIVKTEADARRGGDRSSRIYDRSLIDNVADPLGTCGLMSFCGLAVPFACYTCRHFQPWLDGPHEEFMAALIADRERMAAEDYSPKIYSIRDRIIIAVAEVIQLCAAEREQTEWSAA